MKEKYRGIRVSWRAWRWRALAVGLAAAATVASFEYRVSAQARLTLSAAFERKILKPPPQEAPFDLRFFTGAVKTDSKGQIITGETADPVKNIVGAEAAGERG